VRRQGDEVRITAQLIAVKDGFHLWSETFDRPMKDIFAIQDDISRAVVRELRVRLLGDEAPAPGRTGTTNVQAYNHYLTGRFEWNRRTATSLRAAIESFQAALKLDSNYVMAYVGLADAYVVLAGSGLARPAEVFPPAISATRRALALAPDLSEAHRVQAFILVYYDHAMADGEREYRRALELDPNDAFAHYWYAFLLSAERRFDEAEPQALAGLRSDPAAPQVGLGVAQVYLLKGDYPKALAQARRVAESDPTFAPIRLQLAMIHLGLDQPAEALARVDEAERLGRINPALRALALWKLGRKEEARSLIGRTEAERQSHYVEGWSLALYYSGIGDVKNALRWMTTGIEERSTVMYFSSYLFAPPGGALRKDPRYRQLLEQAGLGGALER
jgi:tetratricopeptide (TPR) repeat protein